MHNTNTKGIQSDKLIDNDEPVGVANDTYINIMYF